jgi:hypothetical protein
VVEDCEAERRRPLTRAGGPGDNMVEERLEETRLKRGRPQVGGS